MTVLAITLAKPHIGKRSETENRARQLAGIYATHGASVKVTSIVSGPNAGCLGVIRGYPDFQAASKALQTIATDPAHIDFWQQREANPSADIVVSRDIVRRVYGKGRWGTHPVSLIRQYNISRAKLADALKLLPEVSEIGVGSDVNVVGMVPVTGDNLSSLSVSYQFRSIDHMGEALDTVSASEAFQAIIAKAAELGTLRSAFMMVPLEVVLVG